MATSPPDDAYVSRLRNHAAIENGMWLREAAKVGAVGEIEALMAAGADAADGDVNGWTALHWAARVGHVEAARRLVALGAPVDARDAWEHTPLHWAAARGYAEIAAALLEAGADTAAMTKWGQTPLDIARGNNQQQLVDLLTRTQQSCRHGITVSSK